VAHAYPEQDAVGCCAERSANPAAASSRYASRIPVVLYYDSDFDRIAAVTGQRCEWVVRGGSND
jgi:hypothetical protein